jgi:hypothetical protein
MLLAPLQGGLQYCSPSQAGYLQQQQQRVSQSFPAEQEDSANIDHPLLLLVQASALELLSKAAETIPEDEHDSYICRSKGINSVFANIIQAGSKSSLAAIDTDMSRSSKLCSEQHDMS